MERTAHAKALSGKDLSQCEKLKDETYHRTVFHDAADKMHGARSGWALSIM